MKFLFLIPPSEGKNNGGVLGEESLSYIFEKPSEIACGVTEKDLKCKGARFEEGLQLNTQLITETTGEMLPVIERYSGVMYNAIDYCGMSQEAQDYFNENYMMISGMYGLLKPQDLIANYKLPIESKGLYTFWGDKITQKINDLSPDYVVNLLPGAYWKTINEKLLVPGVIHINFLTEKNGKIVKISHGVKKIKGEWIKNICENKVGDYVEFGSEIEKNDGVINVNLMY